MINKINSDLEPVLPVSKKSRISNEKPNTSKPEVTVTSQLGKLVGTMVAENNEAQQSENVQAIKRLIDANQYKVDPDALARKLYHSLFANNMDF